MNSLIIFATIFFDLKVMFNKRENEYILYGMSDSVISDLQHIQNTDARILVDIVNLS